MEGLTSSANQGCAIYYNMCVQKDETYTVIKFKQAYFLTLMISFDP